MLLDAPHVAPVGGRVTTAQGISSGSVLGGAFGSEDEHIKLDAMGHAVNLAARLEGLKANQLVPIAVVGSSVCPRITERNLVATLAPPTFLAAFALRPETMDVDMEWLYEGIDVVICAAVDIKNMGRVHPIALVDSWDEDG